jgi:hypothetical protein
MIGTELFSPIIIPETQINTLRVSPAVVHAIEAVYGERPAIGCSGERVPILQAAQAFRNARLALTVAEIGASDEKVAVWTELGSWRTLAILADSYSKNPKDLAELVHPGIVDMVEGGRGDLIHTLDIHTLDAYLTHGWRCAKNRRVVAPSQIDALLPA